MRRLLFVFLALSVVVGLTASSFAASSVSKSTFTASVAFTGTGSITLSASLKDITTHGTTTQISWDPAEITLGSTNWQRAKQYAEIVSVITSSSGLVQIYTDNCATDANPKFYIVTPTSFNPVGLVKTDTKDRTLKTCWRVCDSTITLAAGDIQQAVNNQLYSSVYGSSYPCYIWMKDAKTPNITSENTTQFVNGEDYVTVMDANRGGQHAEGTWGLFTSPDYIYFGAKFTGAVRPATYQTNTLRIEAYIE